MTNRYIFAISALGLGLAVTLSAHRLAAQDPARAAAPRAPALKLLKTLPLNGAGRWDYLGVDGAARRAYVPRSTHVQVVNLDTGEVVGDIPNTDGVHGVALAPEQNLGFSSNGKANAVTVFDLKTLKQTATVNAGKNPDAILYDPASKHIFACNHTGGDVTVIDPAKINAPSHTETIPVGGTLEYGASDEAGHVYVCVEDKSEIVQIDSKANKVLAHWLLAPGESPTGLAIDAAHHRLFAGCGNKKMIVLDSETGKILGTPTIGAGVDGVAFDPHLAAALSANGRDGTISVVQETAPGQWETTQTVDTLKGARTIAMDTHSHQALLPCNVPDGKGGQAFGLAVVGVAENKK